MPVDAMADAGRNAARAAVLDGPDPRMSEHYLYTLLHKAAQLLEGDENAKNHLQ